jgi:hypothetical protein
MHHTQQTPAETAQQWCCRGCDGAFPGTPPWHRLCGPCLDYLDESGFRPDPEWPQDQTPPDCDCCGKPLIPVIPAVLAEEVTSDDR